MKDFAKSIVCNSVTEKEFNTEADLRRWCIEHQYAYTPTHGGYYRLEDDKPGRNRPDLEAHVKAGNSKVGNADKYSGNYIIMSDAGDVWFRDEHEDVSIKNIDSWAQKRIAEYQRSINEIQKGVQEAKQAAKKFGLL